MKEIHVYLEHLTETLIIVKELAGGFGLVIRRAGAVVCHPERNGCFAKRSS
jgi:hypothetical protein